MIGSIRGTIISKKPGAVIVETAGVGYSLSVPLNALSDIPDVGGPVFLHVHTHVREDAIQLFGFTSDDQRRAFVTLLGISGIGPKVAMNIISGIKYDEFLRAVETEDIELLTRIPGLGKKTANRIVLELRGKLPKDASIADRLFEDSLSALVNLGYKKSDAVTAIDKTRKKGVNDIEALIRESLKYLTGAATVEEN